MFTYVIPATAIHRFLTSFSFFSLDAERKKKKKNPKLVMLLRNSKALTVAV